MNRSKQKNLIIGGLLAIVFVMAVGYSAFATRLNISGSGAILNDWSVKITNIESKNIVKTAGNNTEPTYTNTTATFSTTLQSPGDSITYDITVSNEGTLDAQLDKITLINSNNPAIIFETSGLSEGDSLLKKTSKILSVKVTYNNDVTSQPESITANLTVNLEFVQKGTESTETTSSTVYAFNTNQVTIGTSTLSDLGTSYATFAEAAASNENSNGEIALKYIIENNVLTVGYACFLTGGAEYCLKGTTDGSEFANNSTILQTAFGTSSCRVYSSNVSCDGASVDAVAGSYGDVSAHSSSSYWNCDVYSDGEAYCS